MYEAASLNRADDVREMASLMQEVFWRGTIGARLLEAERTLGWGANRVLELFKGKAVRVDAFEKERVRAIKAERDLKAARELHNAFKAETERLAAFFAAQDEDFHRPEIEARRSVMGRVDRSRIGGGQR